MNNIELLRALIVLRLCTSKFLVNNAERLIVSVVYACAAGHDCILTRQLVQNISKRIIGEKLTMNIIRYTFFAHFCAGETAEGTRPTVEKLARANVNAIMDYAAEADIEKDPVAVMQDQVKRRKSGVVVGCNDISTSFLIARL